MNRKPYDHYKRIPELPSEIRLRKRKPKKIAVVDEDNCTGCRTCISFCPTDCIEPVPKEKYDTIIPPVQVRFDECNGCQACVRVCGKMSWDAIRMIPAETFEKRYSIVIT